MINEIECKNKKKYLKNKENTLNIFQEMQYLCDLRPNVACEIIKCWHLWQKTTKVELAANISRSVYSETRHKSI